MTPATFNPVVEDSYERHYASALKKGGGSLLVQSHERYRELAAMKVFTREELLALARNATRCAQGCFGPGMCGTGFIVGIEDWLRFAADLLAASRKIPAGEL